MRTYLPTLPTMRSAPLRTRSDVVVADRLSSLPSRAVKPADLVDVRPCSNSTLATRPSFPNGLPRTTTRSAPAVPPLSQESTGSPNVNTDTKILGYSTLRPALIRIFEPARARPVDTQIDTLFSDFALFYPYSQCFRQGKIFGKSRRFSKTALSESEVLTQFLRHICRDL